MKKRGQVTIFIIVAILIVGGAITFFVFRDNFKGESGVPEEIAPIKNFVDLCLESTGEEGINYIALRGGYYNVPKGLSFSYYTDETSYYYLDSKKYIPSTGMIEKELDNYLSDRLEYCLNFSSFNEQGFEIEEGELLVSSFIKEEEISIQLDFPLVIKKEDRIYNINEFEKEFALNLENFIFASEEIVNTYSKNPGFVCLNCLEDISEEYNLEIKATPLLDYGAIWFSIENPENELNWKFVVENE